MGLFYGQTEKDFITSNKQKMKFSCWGGEGAESSEELDWEGTTEGQL